MAKILFVDDDKDHSKLVQDWLSFEKHEVAAVYCGSDAWKALEASEYDLAILDWDLPDIDGIDILARMRQSGKATPVIMLTGRTSVDDKERGLDSGATDYLTKPFHMKELSARVRAALRNSQAAGPVHKSLGADNQDLLKKADLEGSALAAHYEFLDLIGEGGAAIVFKARHPQLAKFVAIKMLHKQELSQESIARFEREARVISNLEHPNIVSVYDFGLTERKHPYMVMEYIKGQSLDQLLEEEDHLEFSEAKLLLLSVCDGISYAHENQVLHRDIKPANVMLKQIAGRQPLPKVLDFGLAKVTQESQKEIALTKEQQIFGSPPYMSPEQVKGKVLDLRSDIYSFACMLFQVVTGYPPFCGDSAQEIMIGHINEAPLTFEEVCPEITFPAGLEKLISKCLAKNPDHRYQSMKDVYKDLSAIN